jgi:hypothetical protein
MAEHFLRRYFVFWDGASTAAPVAKVCLRSWRRQRMPISFRRDTRRTVQESIIVNEASLYQHVKLFVSYYHQNRTHLSLAKDTPETRLVHPPELGPVVAIAEVGGLHHRYERRAA